ncbi:hypothetical protein [Paraburkholderia fungorum]|uniref:hypothetical protein n=1 Tax=Paraburkholderia fungorum TaxID=134537 RepID=UPI0033136FE5
MKKILGIALVAIVAIFAIAKLAKPGAVLTEQAAARIASLPADKAAPPASAPTAGAEANCTPVLAYVYSKDYVEQNLKAPSSAKFAGYTDSRVNRLMARFEHSHDGKIVSVPKLGCTFRVTSYVDSQNSFGAMLRMHYQVEIEIAGDHWSATSFRHD